MKIIYLAGPYTHSDPKVRAYREEQLTKTAAMLMLSPEMTVYSPITSGHRIADYIDPVFRNDSDFWLTKCFPFIAICDILCVLTIDGWEKSKGVAAEIEEAERLGKKILYYNTDTKHDRYFEGKTLYIEPLY